MPVGDRAHPAESILLGESGLVGRISGSGRAEGVGVEEIGVVENVPAVKAVLLRVEIHLVDKVVLMGTSGKSSLNTAFLHRTSIGRARNRVRLRSDALRDRIPAKDSERAKLRPYLYRRGYPTTRKGIAGFQFGYARRRWSEVSGGIDGSLMNDFGVKASEIEQLVLDHGAADGRARERVIVMGNLRQPFKRLLRVAQSVETGISFCSIDRAVHGVVAALGQNVDD